MKNVFSIMSSMIVLNLLSKGLGFFREYLMAIKFGTSLEADAYLMAANIPNVFFVIIGTAIMTIIIPIYNELKGKKGRNELVLFISNIITILLIISTVLTILCEIFTPFIVKIMAVGFVGYKFSLTVLLTRILASAIVLNTLIYIFTAILQCENNFILPAIIGIPYNIFIIIYFLFFSEKFGVIGIAIIVAIALIIQVLTLFWGLKKINFKYSIYINVKDKYLRRVLVLLPPICIGTGMEQINGIINGIFASKLNSGSVSAINYALKLNSLIVDIIIVTITTVIYQYISKSSNTTKKEFEKNIDNGITYMFIILVPITITMFFFCKYIVKFLLQRGEFNDYSTLLTSSALKIYLISLFALALNYILSRVCYAKGDTKTPMINTFFSLLINIICSIFLVEILNLGIEGIAFSSVLGSWISVIILSLNIKKKLGYSIGKDVLLKMFKFILASLPLIFLIVISRERIIMLSSKNYILEIIKMLLIFLSGMIFYILNLYILNVTEVRCFIKKKGDY